MTAFESPLSAYIRLFCSQCSRWAKSCSTCHEDGRGTIQLCMTAHWIIEEMEQCPEPATHAEKKHGKNTSSGVQAAGKRGNAERS